MVVSALVKKYFPTKRQVYSKPREFRAISILTSIASDFDVIIDWVFYVQTRQMTDVSTSIKSAQLFFCIIGLIPWLILISDGRMARLLLYNCKVNHFSTGHILLMGVLLEDVPQVVLSFCIEGKQEGISNLAIMNMMTALYDILIKLAEAYDERDDLHRVGDLVTSYKGHVDSVTTVAIIDKKTCFVTGSKDTFIRLWDFATGCCVREFKGHIGAVNAIANIDGKSFLSASDDETVKLWDVATGQCVGTFEGHINAIKSVTILDDDTFITGSEDTSIKLWKLGTFHCVRSYWGHSAAITTVGRIATRQTYFLSGSADKTVKWWIRTGDCIRTYEVGSPVESVCDVDGKQFVTGSADRSARLWDLENGDCLRVFKGHLGPIVTCDIVSKGKLLITGSIDSTIKLWNVSNAECLNTYRGHSYYISSVANIDDKTFLSGSHDKTAKRWVILRAKNDKDAATTTARTTSATKENV